MEEAFFVYSSRSDSDAISYSSTSDTNFVKPCCRRRVNAVCLIRETDRPGLRSGVPGDHPSPLCEPCFRSLQGHMEQIDIPDLE